MGGAGKVVPASKAQAQAQQQAEITSTESLELASALPLVHQLVILFYRSAPALKCLQVRCLLRVSIFHTAFLRGIFPPSYFKSVEAAGLDGAPC